MTSTEATIPAKPREKHWLLATSLIATSVALIIISIAVIVALHQPAPWNPLGDYPDQTVLSRVPGHKGPAIKVGGVLSVKGTKCAKEAVTVRGASFYQSVDVPGTFVPNGAGIALRVQGCTTKTFSNPLPEAVLATADNPFGAHMWIITGTETPVRDDGKGEGIARIWKSEPFEVIP